MIFKLLKNFYCRLYRHMKVKANHIFYKWHMRQGKKLSETLLGKKDANTALYIAGPGMGDVLYGAAFLREYRRQNIDDRIVV